jgi:small-conductance mechanosensitive channel/CRP-like cAMP-binding protein
VPNGPEKSGSSARGAGPTGTPEASILGPLLLLLALLLPFYFWDSIAKFLNVDVVHQATLVFYHLLGVFVWLMLAFVVNRLVNVVLWDDIFERRLGRPVPRLLRTVVSIVVVLAAVAGIIGYVFQRSLTVLVAATSGAGILIGFAVRDMIADFFSSIALNLEQPFKPGDFIELKTGEIGRVVDMNWRSTHLVTLENRTVVIPNSMLTAVTFVNYNRPGPFYGAVLEFCLDFDVPPERAIRILDAAARSAQDPIPDGPEAFTKLVGANDLGALYRVVYFLQSFAESPNARDRVVSAVLRHLQQAGLSLAQRTDVYLSRMPARQLDEAATKHRLLAGIDLFQSLEDAEVAALAAKARPLSFATGETLIQGGEAGDSMFVIAEGLVRVYADGGVKVGEVAAGEYLGEMSLLTGEPRAATATAAAGVLLYEIRKEDFSELLRNRPAIAEQLSQIIVRRRQRTQQALEQASLLTQQLESRTFAHEVLLRIERFFGLRR